MQYISAFLSHPNLFALLYYRAKCVPSHMGLAVGVRQLDQVSVDILTDIFDWPFFASRNTRTVDLSMVNFFLG